MTAFFNTLSAWLAKDYGLDVAVLGETALDRAVAARGRDLRLDALAYSERWASEPLERQTLLETILVGETWFFRERAAFDVLAQWAQSEALRGVRNGLRVLVLPCATGEEAWSVAAVLKASGIQGPSVILDAFDLHRGFLETARAGRYPSRRLRDGPLPESWRKGLAESIEDSLIIAEPLRAWVRFQWGNACDPALLRPTDRYHVIFCRNLLIYLTLEARTRLLARLGEALLPGGLLFLGHAEKMPDDLGFVPGPWAGAFAWQRRGSVKVANKAKIRPTPPISASSLAAAEVGVVSPAGTAAEPRVRPTDPGPRELADQGALEPALRALMAQGLETSLKAEDHGLAGVLLDALGRKEEALSRFRTALYLDPSDAHSLAHLALLLDELGRSEEASRVRRRLPSGTDNG